MASQALIVLLTVLLFGVWVPWMKGFDFLDPVLLLCYFCLGVLFVAPLAGGALSADSSQRAPRAGLLKIAAIAGYGSGVSMLLLASGILTVNLTNWHGRLLLPSPRLLGSGLVLSLAACLAMAALSAVLGATWGPKAAKTILRIGFLIVLAGLAFGYRELPEDWRFDVEMHLTTAGLIRLSLQLAGACALGGASLLLLWVARAKRAAASQPGTSSPPAPSR